MGTPDDRNQPVIAIVGCGAITERFYLPALAKHPSVIDRLVLVDPLEERLALLADKFSVKDQRSDYKSLSSVEIDGVIVAAPSHLHKTISVEFLAKGIPVLCEKPLATSAPDAIAMVSLAKDAGVPLQVNQTKRLFPAFREVKRLLIAGELGPLASISYFEGEEYSWPTISGSYFDKNITMRGVVQDRGAHALDLICWWLNSKPEVVDSRNDSFGGREAVSRINLRQGSCEIDVTLSWLGKFRSGYKIVGEVATVEGDLYDHRSVEVVLRSGSRTRRRLKSKEKTSADIADALIENFIGVITQGAAPLVSGEEVIASIELIDESYDLAERFNLPWYDSPHIRRHD